MAIGSFYYDRIDRTEKYITEAIRIKKSIKRFDLYKEFAVLSSVHNTRGEFRVGLEYALKAERIAEREGITDLWQMIIYNYLGSFYIDLESYDKAMEYDKKALELAKKTDNKNEIMALTANINSILYRQGKFAEALAFVDNELHYKPGKECNVLLSSIYLETYCKLKQYKKARPYYENLLKFKDDGRTYDNDKQTMYHAIILYLLETGQAGKSYAYIGRLNEHAKHKDN
jgi:tetratricopeptide (TPR) repeat protein